MTKGRAIQNLLNIDSDDVVTAYLRVKNLMIPSSLIAIMCCSVQRMASLKDFVGTNTHGLARMVLMR